MTKAISKTSRKLSYTECVAVVLSDSPKPLTMDELLHEIEQLREVGSGGRSAVSKAVNSLYQAVPVSLDRYGWLTTLLSGNNFRHPLTAREVRKGFFMLDELEHAVFFPEFFQTYRDASRTLTVELLNGPTLTASAYIEQKTWALSLGSEFGQWIEDVGGGRGDSIIIQAIDAAEGQYVLRLQPHESRDDQSVHERNLILARSAESVVNDDRLARTAVPAAELAARLIALGVFRSPTPPDDLHYVLHELSDLQLVDGGYAVGGVSRHGEELHGHDVDRDLSAADAAMTLFGWEADSTSGDTLWDVLDGGEEIDEGYHDADEICSAYRNYLERADAGDHIGTPLTHEEYHMLEAELEYMVALEVEFGWLLPEQETRRDELAKRLMLDPDSLIGGDMGPTDLDDPSYWEN